jgi:hypothetical protein
MVNRAPWVVGLCMLIGAGCSGTSSGGTGSTGNGGNSLAGTWDLTTTPMGGGGAVTTTVTVGQDSLTITSPDFTLTATRTGNVLSFTDDAPPSESGNASGLTATQTAGTFDAGIVPFDLGGSWTMQAGPTGGSPTVSCTLNVSASEIDGACQNLGPNSPWFSFTTSKGSAAASSFGDLGGSWTNTWTTPGTGGGTFPCALTFTGSSITTCAGGAVDGEIDGSPITGITFTYDGANTVSGTAQGWAEFSATRQ